LIKNDDKGSEIERAISYPDGSVESKSTSKYDKNAILIEKNEIPSCCISVKYEYKYDEKRNLTEEISSKADGSKGTKYAYVYSNFDQEGNWNKKITFENDQPTLITYRELDYYLNDSK